MLESILIALWRTRSGSATVHATAPFAVNRWRSAGPAGPGLGATALTGQHRHGVAHVFARHLFGLRRAGTGTGSLFSTIVGIGAVFAND